MNSQLSRCERHACKERAEVSIQEKSEGGLGAREARRNGKERHRVRYKKRAVFTRVESYSLVVTV